MLNSERGVKFGEGLIVGDFMRTDADSFSLSDLGRKLRLWHRLCCTF